MRYQQFASHAYCEAAGPVSKMASRKEKAFCVLRFEVFRSVITVQREFRARLNKYAPHKINVNRWYRSLWKLDVYVKAGVLVGLVCLKTTLKDYVRRFNEVPQVTD
jgi:hypothetical protein